MHTYHLGILLKAYFDSKALGVASDSSVPYQVNEGDTTAVSLWSKLRGAKFCKSMIFFFIDFLGIILVF